MSVTTAADEVTNMETREASPAHFLIKIESFSLLEKCGIDKYETKEFSAGEYKWRLIIYPNGDDEGKDCDCISVHLAIANTSSLPANWEVNAVFSLFLFNQISANYLSSLGITRRFLQMKSEWGLSKFISKEILLDPSNGYLFNDTCVFGAEVFVIKREAITECLSLKNDDIIPYKRDWKISNFSKLEGKWESEEFRTEDQKWKIRLYPKGTDEATGRGVSIFLYYVGSKSVKACYTICIKNQVSDQHKKKTTTHWFLASSKSWGWGSFIELATINDPKMGFVVNDSCLIDIEISLQAVAQ